ncbi:MAG TPA: ABC transporter permease [Terriglobales bacterium]|jgi:ABC-type dipeptide/oligopeptide/nickel transport system permease subunit
MMWLRRIALAFLLVVGSASLLAHKIAPYSYETQLREATDAEPSSQHLLGTDELGRDRFSRLLYGMRISILMAPAAALLATALAALIGISSALMRGAPAHIAMMLTDVVLSVPWIFVLLTARSCLPLNLSPALSASVTFALLGALGWAPTARIVFAGAQSIQASDYMLQAHALGIGRVRRATQMLPNLLPALMAQFWLTLPLFLLTEANLSILGLGVSEPLPSWGTMLHELQSLPLRPHQPWLWVPLVLLVMSVSSLQFLTDEKVSR